MHSCLRIPCPSCPNPLNSFPVARVCLFLSFSLSRSRSNLLKGSQLWERPCTLPMCVELINLTYNQEVQTIYEPLTNTSLSISKRSRVKYQIYSHSLLSLELYCFACRCARPSKASANFTFIIIRPGNDFKASRVIIIRSYNSLGL